MKKQDASSVTGDMKHVTDPFVYLDHHATTPVDPRVARVVGHYMVDAFGNPSSSDHAYGDQAAEAVEIAKGQVADLLGCLPEEVLFTSGATESLNWALRGTVASMLKAASGTRINVGVSSVEHPAVLETAADLQHQGLVAVHVFSVDKSGNLDIDEIADIMPGLDLVCVMAANHEIGNIYPVSQIADLAHNEGTLFICDASQAVGKADMDLQDMGSDMLAFSAHKLYGPKGVGVLVVREGFSIPPLLTGGGQQGRRRSGTLNVPGIAGTGEACRLRKQEMHEDKNRIAKLRDLLERLLKGAHEEATTNGDRTAKLAGNLNISFPVPAHAVIARIRDQIACSTGSACSSGLEQPSHVLRAMGIPHWRQEGAIRFGLGRGTTEEEIVKAATMVNQAVSAVNAVIAR